MSLPDKRAADRIYILALSVERDCGVCTVRALAPLAMLCESQTRRYLIVLEQQNRLERIGMRGGWISKKDTLDR